MRKDVYSNDDRWLVPEDEKERILDLRPMQLVPPDVGIFDEPTRCYKVNLQWGKIVMGMVSWLAETAPWRDAENEGYFAIEEILRFMQGDNCGSDEMPTLFRQNPVNDCQLQQSLDAGETWATIFDFSRCKLNVQVDSSNYYDMSRDSETIMNEFVENYTTVNNFAPALVYDESDDDFYRDQALCFAIQMFYEAILQLRLEQIRTVGGFRPLAIVVGTMIGGIIAVFTFGTGIAFAAPIIGALISACLYAVPSWNADNSEARWREVQDDIVCCIYTNLKGTTVSDATFETALDGCDLEFPATSVAAEIEQLLDDQEVFIMFLKTWEEAYRIGQIGILPPCPCEDEWTHTFDFSVDNGDWEVIETENQTSGTAGTYVPSTGWQPANITNVSSGNTGNYRRLYLQKLFAITNIIDVVATFDLTKGTYINPADVVFRLADVPATVNLSRTTTQISNGTDKTETLDINKGIAGLSLLIDTSHLINNPVYSGSATLKSITISGTGVNPFT